MKPLVSIVIPVYNGEKYIEECLNSLSKQSYENIEIIIINDGSTDSTWEILSCGKYFGDKYKLINSTNNGVSCARNIGIKKANGDYLLFLDVDDYLDSRAIETCVSECGYHKCDLLRFSYRTTGNRNRRQRKNASKAEVKKSIFAQENKEELKTAFCTGKLPSFGCLFFIKRNLYKKVAFPEKVKYMEDFHYAMDLIDEANRILILDEPFYVYAQHGSSACRTIDVSKRLDDIDERYGKTIVSINSRASIRKSAEKLIDIYLKTELYIAYNYVENKKYNYTMQNERIAKQVGALLAENDISVRELPVADKFLYRLIKNNNIKCAAMAARAYNLLSLLGGINA